MLVLRPGALGDTLLALPALRALRRVHRPLTLAGDGAAARLLRSVGEVDQGLAFDDASLGWLFTGPRQETAVVAWMSDRPPGMPADALVAPSRPRNVDRHCARYLLGTLAPLGIDLTWDDQPLQVSPVQSDEVLIHVGSGSPTKNWPPERFAAVIGTLERPVRLVVGEADYQATIDVEDRLGHRLERLEQPSLEELATHLAGCHAYLGNDSGVSHLAGLCGARSVVMFGPTNPTVWRPVGPGVQTLPFEADPADVAAQLE